MRVAPHLSRPARSRGEVLQENLERVEQVRTQTLPARAVVDEHVGRAFDDRAVSAAVLAIVVHPRERFSVHVDGRRSRVDGERVRAAAGGVNSQIVLARRWSVVHENIG